MESVWGSSPVEQPALQTRSLRKPIFERVATISGRITFCRAASCGGLRNKQVSPMVISFSSSRISMDRVEGLLMKIEILARLLGLGKGHAASGRLQPANKVFPRSGRSRRPDRRGRGS